MYEIDNAKFGAFVAEHRKEKGFTQKELAEKLFISDKAVSKWETGVSIPDAALWIPLAELLGVTVTELLMCQGVEESAHMTSDQVETLVKKAISFSDDNSALTRQAKKQRIFMFGICLLLSCIENLFLFSKGLFTETLLVFDLLGVVFGAYFLLFVKEKLPAYYDENKISAYSDGLFRMNVPGMAFNNSNWPHIVNVGRAWTMFVLAVYPALYGAFRLLLPNVWNTVGTFATVATILGGLFIPMYIVGRKYQ